MGSIRMERVESLQERAMQVKRHAFLIAGVIWLIVGGWIVFKTPASLTFLVGLILMVLGFTSVLVWGLDRWLER